MASLVAPNPRLTPGQVDRERRFFLYMAYALALTAIAGFSFFIVIGMSSFGAPWWVHVHGLTMMGWLAFYVLQNLLVVGGNYAWHRQLGMLGGFWIVWMVPVGFAATAMSVRSGRTPPFFEPAFFLAMDWLNIATFGALATAGLMMRQQRDWHRRLMLGATIALMAPPIGRLLPLPLLGASAVWLISAILLGYLAVGCRFDWRNRGKVHPAYWWSLGAICAMVLLIVPLSVFPPFLMLAGVIQG